MYILMKQLFARGCCILVCTLILFAKGSHQQRMDNEIFFRKCCKENEVYEFIENECIDRSTYKFKTHEVKYPINFVHKDSAL